MSDQKLVPYVHTDGVKHQHYFVDQKTSKIYFERRMKGKKHKFSTGCVFPEILKAKRFANTELEKRLGKKKVFVKNLIKEELELFRTFKASEGHAYDTLNNINRAIDEIKEFWGDMLPNEITDDNMSLFISWWKKNKTIQMDNVIKYLRNFCKYLARKSHNGMPLLPVIPAIKDPDRLLNKAKRKKKKQRIFTAEEFKQVYDTAATPEDALVILFMYTMATRITETLELSFDSEIILEHKPHPIYRWSIGQNKADLAGLHSLHPSLIEPLKTLRKKRIEEGTSRLFPQLHNNQAALKSQQIEWADWEKRAGLDWHWTSHTFRHTCLSNLFNNPNNPQLLICKLYRISLKEAEETYVKPTQEGIELMRTTLEVIL